MHQKASGSPRHERESEEGRKQRRMMTKLEQESPQPSPLNLAQESWGEENHEVEDIECELSSLDSDEEIVICPQTNKFDQKRPPSSVQIQRPIEINSQTECDQQGDGATTQLDDDGNSRQSLHDDRRGCELLSQLASATTTTLSPSPTPRPFRSPTPLSQSDEGAIDSTTTTTHSYSPDEDLPLDHRENLHPVLSTFNRHSSNNSPIIIGKNDYHYLDSLFDSIREGNFATFRKRIEARATSERHLLNVFIHGRTLLHHALKCGRGLEWCKILVERGADPNLSDTYGWHPLHLAAYASGSVTSYIAQCCEAVF